MSAPDSGRAWTAEIEWRHTDAESRFCVIARASQGAGEAAVAQSPPLKWPPTGPDSVTALTEAAASLEVALEVAGWKALPPGSAWYSKRFAWEPIAPPAGEDSPEPVERESTSEPTPAVESGGERRAGRVRPRHGRSRSGERAASDRRRLGLRVAVAALVAGAVAIVAVASLLPGRPFGNDAPSVTGGPAALPQISEAGVRLQIPVGWARDSAAVLGFTHPVRLRNDDNDLRAAVELLPAVSPTLLPAAFLQTLKGVEVKPDAVRLGSGHAAWRYRLPLQGSPQLVMYAVPTTAGVATVACLDSKGAGIPRGCEALASGLTVPDSLPLDPGRSAAFYSRLPASVHNLDAARTKGTRELSAATRAFEQAAAAGDLARAHLAAGADLAPLTVDGDGMPTATVRSLTATAAAYAALARAATARSPQAYADASHAVTSANADLHQTMAKVAAAASAASRSARRSTVKPVRNPVARPQAAASDSKRIDVSLLVLAPLGVFVIGLALGLAIHQLLRVLRNDAPAGLQNALR